MGEPLLRLGYHRRLSDWSSQQDGSDIRDYGWNITLYIRGQHRVRWNSTRGTTPMLWHFIRGADEDCNRAITLTLWPLGMLDVWWEPRWRPAGSGDCDKCRAEIEGLLS